MFRLIFILFFLSIIAIDARPLRQQYSEYAAFGLRVPFSYDRFSMSASGVDLNVEKFSYGFHSDYFIERDTRHGEYIELSYLADSYQVSGKKSHTIHQFHFLIGKEWRYFIGERSRLMQRGGFLFDLYRSNDISPTLFSSLVFPIYQYPTQDTNLSVTGTPKIRGFKLGLDYALGLRFEVIPKLITRLFLGGFIYPRWERVSGTNIESSIFLEYGAVASNEWLYQFEKMSPYLRYRVLIEKDIGTSSGYIKNWNANQTIEIGVLFHFSLLIFG